MTLAFILGGDPILELMVWCIIATPFLLMFLIARTYAKKD